jgi:mechanosensitive ion channel-like protein
MWEQVQQALNQSMVHVITKVADLLPGIAALIVALVVSAIVAGILSHVLQRFLRGLNFDERLVQWGFSGLADWSPLRSPTLLLTRTVSWTIVVVGFLIGISAFDATLTSQLVVRLFAYLPNVVAAVLLLLLGNIIARFLARSVLIGAVNMNLQYARLLSIGVKWLVVVLTVAMVLDHLSIGGMIVDLAFGILFGGIVLALALAVGLGSRDLVSRSLERESQKASEEAGDPFQHL